MHPAAKNRRLKVETLLAVVIVVGKEEKPVGTGQTASFEPGEEAYRCIETLITESSVSTTDKIQPA